MLPRVPSLRSPAPRAVPTAHPSERRDGVAGVEIVLVAATTLAALLLRVLPPWRRVFAGGEVWFQENDPWYHVRVAEAWIAGFPHRLTFDPYLQHPGGGGMPVAPFLDLLLAFPAVVLGLSEHAARVWMAWVPALLGAAGVMVLWALARQLFDRRVALLAGGLLAVEPGGYLVRTLLGFTDHHALEAVLSLVVLWALASALRAQGRRRVIRSGAAGVALGCYLLGWGGGSLLVAVLAAWVGLQALVEGPVTWGRGLAPVLLPALLVAGALLACGLGATPRWEIQALALAGAAAGVTALDALRALGARRCLGRGAFALAALLAGAALLGTSWLALLAAAPEVALDLRYHVLRFAPSGTALTVGEVRPLLLYGGEVSWLPAWLQFRTSFFLGLAGMAWMTWRWWRSRDRGLGLVLVWGLAMLVATLGQVRFAYYLGPALALFAAPVCGAILDLSGAAAGSDASPASRAVFRGVAVVVVALLAFAPSAASALVAAGTDRTPAEPWRQAMEWLRSETPEPFGNPAAYLQVWREKRGREERGGQRERPRSSYGVLSWWDYGYWIIGLGRRVPVSNPTQSGARQAALVFLETDHEAVLRTLDEMGARYLVTEAGFAITPRGPQALSAGRFDAMCQWAEIECSRYYEPVLLPDATGTLRPSLLFRPDYYRTLVARLAVFGTDAVVPRGRVLVAELRRPTGRGPAAVASTHWFDSSREAEEALRSGAVRGSIFGTDPLRSPVLLPAVPGLEQLAVFESVRVFGRQGSLALLPSNPPATRNSTG
jgi:dolichyl-diphosphooligosaccharide--protein glycosyltransferase